MERQFERVLTRASELGELRDDVDAARLARFLQTQIIRLRTFAQRNVPRRTVRELTEDIVATLAHYTRGARIVSRAGPRKKAAVPDSAGEVGAPGTGMAASSQDIYGDPVSGR